MVLDGAAEPGELSGGEAPPGASPSSQGRQRKWSSPGLAEDNAATTGVRTEGPPIEDPQDRPAPVFHVLMHAEREARRPKLSRRRQTPQDSSSSPESPRVRLKRAPPGSVGRAAAAQAGACHLEPRTIQLVHVPLRVGCRSRNGASSPVSCGGEGGGCGREPTDVAGTLETRGSMRWALDSVGRRGSESVARERVPVTRTARLETTCFRVHRSREAAGQLDGRRFGPHRRHALNQRDARTTLVLR